VKSVRRETLKRMELSNGAHHVALVLDRLLQVGAEDFVQLVDELSEKNDPSTGLLETLRLLAATPNMR
jgi:hypothetical protein